MKQKKKIYFNYIPRKPEKLLSEMGSSSKENLTVNMNNIF